MIAYSTYKKSDGSYSIKYKHGGPFFENGFSSSRTNLTRTQANFLRDELNAAAKANRIASGYKVGAK